MAQFSTKAQVAGKLVELKRRGGEKAGKLEKNEVFDFCEVSCTRGHEN